VYAFVQVQNIKNEATEVSRRATAEADYIRTTSQANYTNVITTARSRGLRHMFTSLNITTQVGKLNGVFLFKKEVRGYPQVCPLYGMFYYYELPGVPTFAY